MRLFIVRHAESYSNIQGKIYSSTNLPLTEKGVQQAKAMKNFLFKETGTNAVKHAYCSHLLRARQTADIICEGQFDIIETDHLREMDLGELEGLTWLERARKYPHIDIGKALSTANIPNGEHFQDVEKRCMSFIKEHLTSVTTDSNILIVTHGITKRVLVNCLLHKSSECVNYLDWCDNCSYSEIEFDAIHSLGKLIRLNERQHLLECGLGTDSFDEWAYFASKEYVTV